MRGGGGALPLLRPLGVGGGGGGWADEGAWLAERSAWQQLPPHCPALPCTPPTPLTVLPACPPRRAACRWGASGWVGALLIVASCLVAQLLGVEKDAHDHPDKHDDPPPSISVKK